MWGPSSHIQDIVNNSGAIRGHIYLNDGNDKVINTGSMFGATLLGRGNDIYDGANGLHFGTVEGGGGNDTLTGGDDADFMFGDSGSDLLVGNGGDDLLDGGYGSDLIDGGDGFDLLSYLESPSAQTIDLEAGAARGGSDIDYFRGIEAVAGSRGADRIYGSAGDDTMMGAGGNDLIDGRSGRDVLVGGGGNDVITTGVGADRILFSAGDGRDRITDFSLGDRLEIYGYAAARSIAQTGADVLITLSSSDSILVQNRTVGQLAPSLFFSTGPSPIQLPDVPVRTFQTGGNLTINYGMKLDLTDTNPLLIEPLFGGDIERSFAVLVDGSEGGYGVWNAGGIRYEAFEAGAVAVAVGLTTPYVSNKSFVNYANGTVETLAHATDAIGVYAPDKFFNAGRLVSTSESGDAYGVFGMGLDAGSFVNSGSIQVTAAARASAASQWNSSAGPMQYFNSGSITVAGHDASQGFDLKFFAHPLASQPYFVNSGNISVTDQTVGLDSVALDIALGSRVRIWNSGAISADYAIRIADQGYNSLGYDVSVYNSGQINGEISLSTYADLLINSGTITGFVFMGGGDDIYDGRAGRLTATLDGYDGDDILLAGVGNQTILGGFGNDILSGGAGTDRLIGGYGQDHFRYQNGFAADTIVDFQVGASGDVLDISGYASYQSIVQSGADVVITFSATDTLTVLNASIADVSAALRFGAAPIAAYQAPAAPLAPPAPAQPASDSAPTMTFAPLYGTSGADTLTGGGANERFIGLGGDDVIDAKGGNDVMDGGIGADRMVGGLGNDSYYVDNVGDVVVEDANAGTDTVYATVSRVLEANAENLILTGAVGLTGTGNALDNAIVGNSGNNRISGREGSDRLTGNGGNDIFLFDTAIDGGSVDTITDFTVGSDRIWLDRAIFSAINTSGTLAASAFATGTSATSAATRIIYDNLTGDLFYDADGTGSAAAIRFAHVNPGLSVSATSFQAVGVAASTAIAPLGTPADPVHVAIWESVGASLPNPHFGAAESRDDSPALLPWWLQHNIVDNFLSPLL